MTCAIAVMAKAPHPGRCKTRLVPPLTPEQAAALSCAFLRDITENLAAAAGQAPIAPYVAYAPADAQTAFDGLLADGTRLILADGAPAMPAGVTGFGRALLHAVQSLLERGHASVCVLNSDSPTLPTSVLLQAAEWLGRPGDRVVMAPADDGGYTLLGVKAAHAGLFTDIAWSTDRVAEQTRQRARDANLDMVELQSWYDVDDAASLRRLQADLERPGDAYPALHTAAHLHALGASAARRAAP